MAAKRGLLVIGVIATLVVFIGLVWAIITYLPLNSAASPNPSQTIETTRMAMNCASPVAYWTAHAEYYPRELIIAGKVFSAADIKGFFDQQGNDLAANLQAQLVAAYLNIQSGADASYIQGTIFDAYGWLMEHPNGSTLEAGDQDEGSRLYTLLEAYNRGQTGVVACEIAYPILQTELSRATDTATTTNTETPISSETVSASETPSPTDTETYAPIYTYVLPSKTPTKTTAAPIYSSPVPSQTPTSAKTIRPTNIPVTPNPTFTYPIPPPTEPPPNKTLTP